MTATCLLLQTISEISRIFLKYGPIPRLCLGLAGNERRISQHEAAIRRALLRLDDQVARWLQAADTVEGISHTIFGVQPIANLDDAELFPLTPYISDMIIQKALAIDIRKAKEIFDAVLSLSVTRTAAGHAFEKLLFWRLRMGGTIKIKLMGGSDPGTLTTLTVEETPSGIDPLSRVFRTPQEMQALLENNEGQLILPMKSNFPSIDALLRCGETIWIIQVTLAQSHTIKVSGLNEVASVPKDWLYERT